MATTFSVVSQTFAEDFILVKLIAWFNALTAAGRTIGVNDFPIYKIKVISNNTETPDILIQPSPGPLENYLGEVTFVWTGVRGTPATADATSFLEIARYIEPSVPVVPYVAPTSPGGPL